MSIVTIKITIVAIVLTIVAAIVAIGTDTQNAAAQSNYLAPSFNTSIVKHADVDPNARMDIAFGSDDAAYRLHTERMAPPALFSTLTTTVIVAKIVPASLPNTAAPHGAVSCTITDSHHNVFTVQADDCSTL